VGQCGGKKKREPKLPWSSSEVVARQPTVLKAIKLCAERGTLDMSAPDVNLAACHSSSLCWIIGKINVINAVLNTKPINPSHIPCGSNMDNDRAKMIVLTTKARP
jgi:hypothetical protein